MNILFKARNADYSPRVIFFTTFSRCTNDGFCRHRATPGKTFVGFNSKLLTFNCVIFRIFFFLRTVHDEIYLRWKKYVSLPENTYSTLTTSQTKRFFFCSIMAEYKYIKSRKRFLESFQCGGTKGEEKNNKSVHVDKSRKTI